MRPAVRVRARVAPANPARSYVQAVVTRATAGARDSNLRRGGAERRIETDRCRPSPRNGRAGDDRRLNHRPGEGASLGAVRGARGRRPTVLG